MTIISNDFEGVFYDIVGDDGGYYDPINLPAEYKKDGLYVNYIIRIIKNQASSHMWGTVVEIISIKKL